MSTPARTRAARPPRTRSRLGSWLDHHVFSLVASLGRMARKPWATGLTVGVMAIALALPLGLWAVLENLSQFTGDVQASRQVSVYLVPGQPLERAQALAGQLRARADVAGVDVRSADEGLAELRRHGGLAEAADALGENPLPHLLRVTPRGDDAALAASLEGLPGVDAVQHDAAWRQRLARWLTLGQRIAWVLAAMLGLGALLVVGNTVRLDIQSRREEIDVLQLLGATDGFIRRPFLYLGACYGLLAGALALGLLTAADLALREPVAELARSYGSAFRLQGFDAMRAAVAVLGAGAIGWLGAGLVAGHYLRQTRSTGR
ncbi:MAG: permease-like cell division protein FtsX [Pseudomonadota bacterium]